MRPGKPLAFGHIGYLALDWGFDGAAPFTGSQERCVGYDRHGRCLQTVTTRFYECEG